MVSNSFSVVLWLAHLTFDVRKKEFYSNIIKYSYIKPPQWNQRELTHCKGRKKTWQWAQDVDLASASPESWRDWAFSGHPETILIRRGLTMSQTRLGQLWHGHGTSDPLTPGGCKEVSTWVGVTTDCRYIGYKSADRILINWWRVYVGMWVHKRWNEMHTQLILNW